MSIASDKLNKSNDQLQESIKTIDETEQLASQTLSRLREQRESIQRSKTRMEDVDKNLKDSESTINRMDNSCVVTDEERAKTSQAFQGLQQLLCLRKTGAVSQEAFDLTTAVLMLNPEISTAWNYRRDLIQALFPGNEDRKIFLSKELKLLEKVLHQTLKSYAVWAHRKWVLKNIVEISSGDQQPLRDELSLCRKLFDYDARNFHCWNHRLWVVGQLPDRKSLDLEISKDLIMKDPGNYSAWHVRSTGLSDISDGELEMTRQAVYTEPNDQSVWQYRRWLFEEFPLTRNFEDTQAIDKLLALEPDAKYALLEISRRPETTAERKSVIYGRLKEIDPMRRGYYERLALSL